MHFIIERYYKRIRLNKSMKVIKKLEQYPICVNILVVENDDQVTIKERCHQNIFDIFIHVSYDDVHIS